MELESALGLTAAPGIVAGVLGALKVIIDRHLAADAHRLIALLLGVLYAILLFFAGLLDVDNVIVAGLLGVPIGLGAMGWRDNVWQRVVVGSGPP